MRFGGQRGLGKQNPYSKDTMILGCVKTVGLVLSGVAGEWFVANEGEQNWWFVRPRLDLESCRGKGSAHSVVIQSGSTDPFYQFFHYFVARSSIMVKQFSSSSHPNRSARGVPNEA